LRKNPPGTHETKAYMGLGVGPDTIEEKKKSVSPRK
jgi:hypothetical protein